MGKTIQMISLFVSDLKKPNLVIAWVSLRCMHVPLDSNLCLDRLLQLCNGATRSMPTQRVWTFSFGTVLPVLWMSENSNNMMSYANLNLWCDSANADYGQVLTSYAVVESCFRKQESGFKRKGHIVKEVSPLHQIKWNRIVVCFVSNYFHNGTNFTSIFRGSSLMKLITSRSALLILPKLALN